MSPEILYLNPPANGEGPALLLRDGGLMLALLPTESSMGR